MPLLCVLPRAESEVLFGDDLLTVGGEFITDHCSTLQQHTGLLKVGTKRAALNDGDVNVDVEDRFDILLSVGTLWLPHVRVILPLEAESKLQLCKDYGGCLLSVAFMLDHQS